MGASANTSRIDRAPVVVVGQARSGSSLLTLMLNLAGGFVVNDAYALQAADELGLTGARPAPGAAARYREACHGILRARTVSEGPPPIHRSAVASGSALRAAAAVEGEGWAEIWGGMLAAAAPGAAFRGWNTPPDHLRAEEILAAFPQARFVFLMRDPWAVLRSYKALPPHWGRERARYHPALQARAWAASARSRARMAAERPGRACLIRYEDLVARPRETFDRLSAFLGVPLAAPDPATLPRNASRPGAALSRAELWAAAAMLGDAPARLGYAPPRAEGLGALDLARRSLAAGGYYLSAAARSRDMRRRILRMASA